MSWRYCGCAVIRSPAPSGAASGTLRGSCRTYLQHRERILGEHGAGLIRHQSLADKTLPATVSGFHNLVRAAPAADLIHTTLHEGTGTSERDPYERTLPNMESIPPASTVLQSSAPQAPNLEERQHLHKRWLSLSVWLDDPYPRLPMFVEQCKIVNPLPVSPAAEALLQELETSVLPFIARSPAEVAELQQWWRTATAAYRDLAPQYLLDRESFLRMLKKKHEETLAAIEHPHGREQLTMAAEVLRRKAVLQHNYYLDAWFSSAIGQVRSPSLVWAQFFEAVQKHKKDIFTTVEETSLIYAWEALMSQDTLSPPSLSASAALFFALGSLVFQQRRSTTASAPEPDSARYQRYLAYVSVDARRRFVMERAAFILSDEVLTQQLAAALQAEKFLELSRDLSMCVAMQDSPSVLRLEVQPFLEPFDSYNEVKFLFSSIQSSNAVEAKHHLHNVLSVESTSRSSSVNFDTVLEKANWKSNWKSLATALLMDKKFTVVACDFIKNAIGAKGVENRLFHRSYADALTGLIQSRVEREASRKTMVEQLAGKLASYEMVDRTTRLLLQMGMSSKELDSEAMAAEKKQQGQQPQAVEVSATALQSVLQAVQQRHPSWVKSGVIPSQISEGLFKTDPVDVLRLLMRVFIRLAYVPQAGAAMIARHTRHRIGPVGLEAHQFNVPTEFGMVEQYDNLQYKKYDWQGWYQRMVDIHNRNVSIRCRLDDLKRLDSFGNPFVDLQTERRLRILSGSRVGTGVLKLDSDKYEDQSDNVTFGTTKLSEILAESRKAQLGPEYWPTVEVKVRKPSGQSQAYYSIIDNDRIEKRSMELYEKYKEAKKRSLFVTPMELWLPITGVHAHQKVKEEDDDGYSVASLQTILNETDSTTAA